MRDFNPNELLQMLQSFNKTGDLNSTINESILEKYACVMLEALSKIKEQKISSSADQTEEDIVVLINKVLKAMGTKKTNNTELILPNSLIKHYLMEKLICHNSEAFLESEVPEAYSLEIIKTAEDWIGNIKLIYSKINTDPRNLKEERQFWSELSFELKELSEFSLSEEFQFIASSLKKLGKLSILYTLQSLISDTKVLKLCGKFNEYLNSFDVSFLVKIPINSIEPSHIKNHIYFEDGFICNSLAVIEQIKVSKKQPRVIRRSLANNLNKLREEILKNAILNFSEKHKILFAAFNDLAIQFNLDTDNDVTESRISIDHIEPFNTYLFDLDQISKGYDLKTFASSRLISDFINQEDNLKADSDQIDGEYFDINEIDDCINDLITQFKVKILEEESIFNDLSFTPDIERRDILDIESYNASQSIFKAIAAKFTSRVDCCSKDIATNCVKFTAFLQFESFSNSISCYLESVTDIIFKEIANLSFSKGKKLVFNENSNNEEIKKDMDMITKIAEILSSYQVIEPFYKSKNPIKNQIAFIKSAVDSYCQSLPEDLSNFLIFEVFPAADAKLSTVDQINYIERNESMEGIKMNKIHLIWIDENNEFFQSKLPKLMESVKWIKPRYIAISKILDDFYKINQRSNSLDEYVFSSERFEKLIKGLINLKWKYFRDSQMEEISIEFLKIQEVYLMYSKVLYDLNYTLIPELLNQKNEINFNQLLDHLLSFNNEISSKFIEYSKLEISKGIMNSLISMIENYQTKIIIRVCEEQYVNNAIHIKNLIEARNIIANDVFTKIITIYKISSDLVSTGLVEGLMACISTHLKNFFDKVDKIPVSFNNQQFKCSSDGSIASLIELISDLSINKQALESLKDLNLFDVKFSSEFPDFDKLILSNIKFFHESFDQFRDTTIEEIGHLINTKSNNGILYQFMVYSQLKRLGSLASELIHKVSTFKNLNCNSQNTSFNVYFDRLCSNTIKSPHSCEEIKFLLAFFEPEDKLRDELLHFSNFKLEKSLPEFDFKQIKDRREQIELQISAMNAKADDFEGDEFTFMPIFDQFSVQVNEITKTIEHFNDLLIFYKFKPLLLSIDLKSIENEYLFAMMKTKIIEEYYNLPVKNNPIISLADDFPQLLRTQLAKNLKNEILTFITPISFISDLSKDYIEAEFFNSNKPLKEYLQSFNEDEIKEQIEKSKCNYQVTKYLKTEKTFIDFTIETKELPLITNFDQYTDNLDTLKSDLELIYTFNKFNMHLNDLRAFEEILERKYCLINKVSAVQDKMIELSFILRSEGMEFEKINFDNAKEKFVEVINKVADCSCSIDGILDDSNKIEEIISKIQLSINNSLHKLRSACNRLYFISNEDLLHGMSNPSYVLHILKTIFHVCEIIVENDKIVGISSTIETFSIKFAVPLNNQIHKVVNDFSLSLQITLIEYFIYHNQKIENIKKVQNAINKIDHLDLNEMYSPETNKIEMIDELITEFRHFNGISKSKTYRIERIEEYATDHHEILSIFPKPHTNENIEAKEFLISKNEEFNFKDALSINTFLNIGTFEYEFEYYPPNDFIFTSLTAKIFSNIILCKNKSGMILYGPSGTGKTESVKYFCKTIGKPLFVFCCNEKCDYESLRNIIMGCVITRNYICFDEFNRLKKEVMSAITELIVEYKDKIKVFLTMNFGYKGRSELPKSLKYIFGEVFVSNPNIKDIIMYHSKNLKIFNLLESLKSNCTNDETYDFGLRAVKSIFNNSQLSHPGISNDILNLLFFYMATFNEQDRQVLVQKIKEILGISLEKHKIDFSYENIFKSGLSSRNGIILLGKVGKSTLVSRMKNEIFKLNTANLKERRVYKYNPINLLLSNDSVFGSINKVTKEWENSIFLTDLKKCLISEQETWFIFDGPIRSEWIEDFNSLFDDNRILCLSSGEIIKVPFCFKFIFETDDISQATPATLTRMYLIKININPTIKDSEEEIAEIESEEFINEFNLLNNQIEARSDLKALLKRSNVVILLGPPGSGKKTIIKSINNAAKVLYSDRLVDFAENEKFICIENFENASISLQEQVREFWESKTIGNVEYLNLKIVCCVDTSNISFVKRIPKVYLKPINHIEEFINQSVGNKLWGVRNTEIICNFTLFIYKTLNLSMGSLLKFIKLLDPSHLNNSVELQDYLNFVFEIVYNENRPCKRYLEKLIESSISKLSFNIELGFKKVTNLSYFEMIKSRMLFLFSNGINIVFRGSRLSGKRTLVDQCIKQANQNEIQNIKVFTWETPEKINSLNYHLSKDSIYVFVLLDHKTPISNKFLNENSIEIFFENQSNSIDLAKIKNGNSLFDSVTSNKQLQGDKISFESDKVELTKISTTFDQIFDKSLEKLPNLIEFNNFFKAVNFYYNFNYFKLKFKENFNNRAKFLSNGLKSIEKFESEASDLKASIEMQSVLLVDKKKTLMDAIDLLAKERIYLNECQLILKADQDQMNIELEEFKNKKSVVEDLLEKAENLLIESKECISQLTKAQLSEIKSMSNPPEIFRKTIEFTYFLIENSRKSPEWSFLQGYLKNNDFISKVINFKLSDDKIIDFIKQNFLDLYTLEKSQKVSKACFALHNWINSVVKQRQIVNEVVPLRAEVESLKINLEKSKSNILQKENDLSIVSKRSEQVEIDKLTSEDESFKIENKIKDLSEQLEILEKVIKNFKIEREQWNYIGFRSPVAYLLDPSNYLDFSKELYIDRNTLVNHEFIESKKSFVEVSVKSPAFKNAISNSLFFKNDLLVKDVDSFDASIYSLIKQINNRFISNQTGSKYDVKTCQQIILQSNYRNFYEEETYEFVSTPKFRVDRISNLESLENGLLSLLNCANCDLKAILDHQIELETERRLLVKEGKLRDLYAALNNYFNQANQIFVKEYGSQLSFAIYSEFINFIGISHDSLIDEISKFFRFSFRNQLQWDKDKLRISSTLDTSFFDVAEINNFSFDYTFITDFNDILFEIEKVVKIDCEISSGSPESNSKIIQLLQESSNKTVLVKNIQFLPACVKTGSNRFIFIIGKNESHSLTNGTRIVYLDKNASFDVICKSLTNLMGMNRTISKNQEKLIKFHSIGVSLSLNLAIRDLEICLDNSELDFDFLTELIYYPKLSEADQRIIRQAFSEIAN